MSFILSTAMLVAAVASAGTNTGELPDFGGPWGTSISQSDEYRLGRMIVHRLRDAGGILEDPELTEYIQTVGHQVSAQAHDGEQEFEFFVVNEPGINAFALPGGFIGINAGLLLATKNESELAGVLAHEVAHVTQRHVARMIQAQGQTGLASTIAMLGAILIGAVTGMDGDAMQAALAVVQGMAIQQSINYTREHEYEADRVGVGILAKAGFDPQGMPSFFETLSRHSSNVPNQIPEFLRSHPVSSNRIAETRNRADKLPAVEAQDSANYRLMRARLRVLTADNAADALQYFRAAAGGDPLQADEDIRYGYGTALFRSGRFAEAVEIFRALLKGDETIIAYHSALAQAYVSASDTKEAFKAFAVAMELFPRNTPLTMRYSEALMHNGNPQLAHTVLLDLLNNIRYTRDQVWLIAKAANSAGDTADAHYYMSEFHVLNGELPMALHELELALATPNILEVQRARFQARADEIREHLPKKKRGRAPEKLPAPRDPGPDKTSGPVTAGG